MNDGGEEREEPPLEVASYARQLRAACVAELGEKTFSSVYDYLRRKERNACAEDDHQRMRADLLQILGESKLRYWPLVDKLIFCEGVEKDALMSRA